MAKSPSKNELIKSLNILTELRQGGQGVKRLANKREMIWRVLSSGEVNTASRLENYWRHRGAWGGRLCGGMGGMKEAEGGLGRVTKKSLAVGFFPAMENEWGQQKCQSLLSFSTA